MKWVENGESQAEFVCRADRPNVFLLGDSIRKGYCAAVRESLCDEAEVFYFEDNCRSTQYVIFNLKKWAGMFDDCERVDLVHFNCGHWDVAHWNGYALPLTSPSEYEKNLIMIIDLLRRFFPNARLVFATTTPMNPDGGSVGGVNPRSDAIIDEYNAIATRVAAEKDVTVNDLNAYARSWGPDCFTDTCHLTREAFTRLGDEVARQIRGYLGGA